MLQEAVRLPKLSPPPNARERVRLAIKRRLDETGMTGRAFGRAFSANDGKGHGDQWVSNLLADKHTLSLDELDEAARILKTKATELVRSEYERAEFLRPEEQDLIDALRKVPPVIRDHLTTLAEYLVGVAPDEVDLLDEYRELSAAEQIRIRHWIHVTRLSAAPAPGLELLPDQTPTASPSDESGARNRGRRRANR